MSGNFCLEKSEITAKKNTPNTIKNSINNGRTINLSIKLSDSERQ
jgi:hypothetical protein